jgi:sirohydrochlorin ferrochelatase
MIHNSPDRMSLVLASHGAKGDPRCAEPVRRHAATIRKMGIFSQVLAIYWKEEPRFQDLYDLTSARDLLVVPVMMAGGYYASTVLPRELRIDHPPAGRTVRVSQAIGDLPSMTEIVIEQGISAALIAGIDPGEARALIIGHGTRRDPARSGATTLRHAAAVQSRNVFAGTTAGFLEQDPDVAAAFKRIEGREPIIVVPFLVANGGHAVDDIPRSLGVEPGTRIAARGGRPLIFADAVGEHPRIVNLILQAADQARTRKTKVA